jgi:hypothetical protein
MTRYYSPKTGNQFTVDEGPNYKVGTFYQVTFAVAKDQIDNWSLQFFSADGEIAVASCDLGTTDCPLVIVAQTFGSYKSTIITKEQAGQWFRVERSEGQPVKSKLQEREYWAIDASEKQG